jgi:hypothetical protein
MKENMKKVYLTPSIQVKSVAVENGFAGSVPVVNDYSISTEAIMRDGGDVIVF